MFFSFFLARAGAELATEESAYSFELERLCRPTLVDRLEPMAERERDLEESLMELSVAFLLPPHALTILLSDPVVPRPAEVMERMRSLFWLLPTSVTTKGSGACPPGDIV